MKNFKIIYLVSVLLLAFNLQSIANAKGKTYIDPIKEMSFSSWKQANAFCNILDSGCLSMQKIGEQIVVTYEVLMPDPEPAKGDDGNN